MSTTNKLFKSVLIAGSLASVTGWANAQEASSIEAREQAIRAREAELLRREQAIEAKMRQLGPKSSNSDGMADVLPNARPGQCFAKVLTPAQYKTVSEKVMISEPSSRIEIIPAQYKTVEEKVLIKEASEKVIEVPAVYKTVKEQVLVEAEQLVWRKGSSRKSSTAPASWVAAAVASGIPTTAQAGQCFAEFHQATQYKTIQEKVLKREASNRIEIVPAKYEWVEEKVLIRETSEKIIDVPAVYETQKEKILERAAYTTWKKGRGPIEKVSHSTGEIMCLIEVPAQYKTISKKVLKTPATTKKVIIPAEHKIVKVRKLVAPGQEKKIDIPAEFQMLTKKVKVADEIVAWRPKGAQGEGKPTGRMICRAKIPARHTTVSKQVIATPATTKKVVIPAEHKRVKVKKLVSPAQEKKINIPAKFSEVTKRVKVSGETLAWRPVLCETNTSPGLVTELQGALKKAGFNPGPVDGVMGRQTYVAIEQFQRKNGFETGGLTLRTLEALNVKVRK